MRVLQSLLGCALVANLGGCLDDIIEHAGVDESNLFDLVSADGGVEGNFPEPAVSRCGELPNGVEAIPDLVSAYGVAALPGAQFADGHAVDPGSVRLRLADHPMFDCAEPFLADNAVCEGGGLEGDDCGWGVGLTLAPGELLAGTYAIETLQEPDYSVAVFDRPADRDAKRSGTLILHRVTPDCVVGELLDVQLAAGEPAHTGGFIAELCQRQCIPSSNEAC
ncbi:MAG: hypothetical protein AAF721_20470 [Myxococcota bacterium]